MAIAQPRREQHAPKLVAPQEHHQPLGWPVAVTLRPQQQPPEIAGLADLFKQSPALGELVLLAGGVGTGHQHQPQTDRRAAHQGAQRLIAMQAQGQGLHPGGHLARAIAHQHQRHRCRSWGWGRWRSGCRSSRLLGQLGLGSGWQHSSGLPALAARRPGRKPEGPIAAARAQWGLTEKVPAQPGDINSVL